MNPTFEEVQEPSRHGLAGGLAGSIVAHLMAASLLLFVGWQQADRPPDIIEMPPMILGWFGPPHQAAEIDELQPNGLRFYFSRPAQRGTPGAGESPNPQQQARAIEPVAAKQARTRRPVEAKTRSAERDGALANGGLAGQAGDATTEGDPEIVDPQLALNADVTTSDTFVILKMVKPTYPEIELNKRIAARIVVAVHVASDGSVDQQQVREASADPPGPTRAFELTALDALRQWRIRLPEQYAKSNGEWLLVPIEFKPEEIGFGTVEQATPVP